MNTSTNLIQPTHFLYRWREVEKLIINLHGLLSPYWLSNYIINSRPKRGGEGEACIGGTTLGYDDNGNLTSYGSKSYEWDYRNRLASSTETGVGTLYFYDQNNQRVKKTSNGVSTIYPNQYMDIEGATTTRYIYANGELLASIAADGISTTTSYIHNDYLGSTNAVSDGSSGALVKSLDYYPYGSKRINSGSQNEPKTFVGLYKDDESNLTYANARYYDNARGQFVSQDPGFLALGDPFKLLQVTSHSQNEFLSDPQVMNSYSWGRNNPITNKDPEGKFSIGASYSGNLEGGFAAYGANYFSVNVNLVVDPSTRQAYIVQSNSWAVNSGYMDNYQSVPDSGKAPFVLGLYAGRGWSGSFSSQIKNPNEIQGVEDGVNVNAPVVSFSAYGEKTGKPNYSLGIGAKGLYSVSQYPVYTQVNKVISVNQAVSTVTNSVNSYYQSVISSIQAQINSIQRQINQLKASLSGNNKKN